MPCFIRRLTSSGLHEVDYSADSLADAERHEPHGVYTITNTFHATRVLKLDAHLDRMENSARLSGMPLALDRPRLRAALREMILASGYGDVRFRITVPRDEPETAILSLEPFKPLAPETYANGVRVMTVQGPQRDNPGAKTTEWAHDRKAIEASFPPGVFTGLLVAANGDILEGMSSNFYAIKSGVLHTAVEGVLPGISQQIVLEVAPSVLPVQTTPVHLDDMPHLSEAFITSASRGIVPVITIDDIILGDGVPGPLTGQLRAAYKAWMDTNMQEL